MERVGSECLAEDIPFFLEIVTYDATNEDVKGAAFAKVKPRKVIEAMKEFSKANYNVDVLKMEVPVNMNFVEGYAKDGTVYTKEEAAAYFKPSFPDYYNVVLKNPIPTAFFYEPRYK